MYYTVAVTLWTTLGLSHIPLESAVGMVLSWHGLMSSVMDNVFGSTVAFCAGLQAAGAVWVRGKLPENPAATKEEMRRTQKVLPRAAEVQPTIQTALFSLVPDAVRNVDTAVLSQKMGATDTVVATLSYMFPSLLVWTTVGIKAGLHGATPSARALGMGGLSPFLMGWWVRTLHQEQRRPERRVPNTVEASSWPVYSIIDKGHNNPTDC